MGIIREKKITSKYSKVMLTESLYSLALYIYMNNSVSDTLFLIGDNVKLGDIKNKLNNVIIYNNELACGKNRTERIMMFMRLYIGRFYELKKYITCVDDFYGHDHVSFSSLFDKRKFTVIEDGLSNYKNPKISNLKVGLLVLFRVDFRARGYNVKTNKVILTGLDDIPESIRDKVTIINRNDFINNLEYICDGAFSYKEEIKDKSILLITQPLSEDDVLSEFEKIEIYKEILGEFINSEYLIIKPHPRERTDYKLYFPNATIIKSGFLVESLLNKKSIIKVVTLFSTAVFSIQCVDVEIYGTGKSSKLSSRYGVIKSNVIQKRI